MPKVSIVMSVYNGEKFLKKAVASILAQTFEDFEFIIINDGSTDRTEDIIKNYDNPRIRLINQENRGLTRSLNRGIGLSKGEYIARMDADDISHPRRIESQVGFLDLYPKVSLLGTACFRIDLSGKITGILRGPTGNSAIQRCLVKRNIFCHGSVMFRKRAFESVHGYNESFECAQDFDLWLRMSSRFEVGNLSEILYAWRDHTSSISSIKDCVQIRSTLKAKLKSSPKKQYEALDHLNTLRNFIAMITPGHMRNFIRKILLRPVQDFFHFRRYRNDREHMGRPLDNVWKI